MGLLRLELATLRSAAHERAQLENELAAYDKEFKSLKSQDITVKKLQAEARAAEARAAEAAAGEARALDAAERQAREASEREAARAAMDAQADAQARQLVAALAQAQEEARCAMRNLESTQAELFDAKAEGERAGAAAEAEFERLRDQLTKASLKAPPALFDAPSTPVTPTDKRLHPC